MNYTYKDKGEFLRGFLVLAKKDQKISAHEKSMAMVVGNYFGFDEKFCEESIKNILDNEYVSEEPPLFSSTQIAQFFVEECLDIFKHINYVNGDQRTWLQKTLITNGLDTIIKTDNNISH